MSGSISLETLQTESSPYLTRVNIKMNNKSCEDYYNEACCYEKILRELYSASGMLGVRSELKKQIDTNVLEIISLSLKSTPQDKSGETVLVCIEAELIDRGIMQVKDTSLYFKNYFPKYFTPFN